MAKNNDVFKVILTDGGIVGGAKMFFPHDFTITLEAFKSEFEEFDKQGKKDFVKEFKKSLREALNFQRKMLSEYKNTQSQDIFIQVCENKERKIKIEKEVGHYYLWLTDDSLTSERILCATERQAFEKSLNVIGEFMDDYFTHGFDNITYLKN